MVGYSVLG